MFSQSSFQRDLPELCIPARVAAFHELTPVVFNEQLGVELGITSEQLTEALRGTEGFAAAYAGHQFGQLQHVLGDGRALTLGSVASGGAGTVELSVKGSGPTVFSRGGDGKAALGPMLREYLVSESMHALGVPTTRSLAVYRTGESVLRQHGSQPGALVVRVAKTQVRVGTFEFVAMRSSELLQRLLTHTAGLLDVRDDPLAVFDYVLRSQARLVAKWMRVGFIHGVMNTDNVQLSGETLDYGPCGFLDAYNPQTWFSSIDQQGRYRFSHQPEIMAWNLARFGECLVPLTSPQALNDALRRFPDYFSQAYAEELAEVLGVREAHGTEGLQEEFLAILEHTGLDYAETLRAHAKNALPDEFAQWKKRWAAAGGSLDALKQKAPVYIPRNLALDDVLRQAEAGDLAPFLAMLARVSDPFTRVDGFEHLAAGPGSGAREFVSYCGT